MMIIRGEGPIGANICIIGEAPGVEEYEQGKPFVGKSGKLLNKALLESGIDRANCYITNAVKIKMPNNKTPTKTEILYWRTSLIEELQSIKPKLIITLGAVPLKAITLDFNVKITKQRGKLYQAEYNYFPMFHPAYIIRNPNKYKNWVEDFKRIKT